LNKSPPGLDGKKQISLVLILLFRSNGIRRLQPKNDAILKKLPRYLAENDPKKLIKN